MNTFILVICLQDVFKTSCKNIYMNIFILMICLFKKSSRRFAKTSRYLQDVLKTFLRDVFNTFLRSTAKMINQVTILRNLWLGYKISKSKVFGYSKTFQTAFFKNFLSSDCFYKQRYHC